LEIILTAVHLRENIPMHVGEIARPDDSLNIVGGRQFYLGAIV
jgi:hypothetical protein